MRSSTFGLNIGVLTLTLLASFCDVNAIGEQSLHNIVQNPAWVAKKNNERNRKQNEEIEEIVKNAVKIFDPVDPTEINPRPNNIPVVTERPHTIRQSTFSPSAIDPTKTPSVISKPINPIFPREKPKYCSDCECGVQNDDVESRIVDGSPTNHRKWSWAVNIIKSGHHHCGGSLITQRHVLTAAHCLEKREELPYMDLVFANKEIRSIESVSIHRDYYNVLSGNDIAIIRLTSPVTVGEDLRTICLPKYVNSDYTGFNATIIGWGDTYHGQGQSSKYLRQVSVPIISASTCKTSGHYLYDYVNDNMICAANFEEGGKGACQGDSGGPLQVRKANGAWEIIGIVSWSRNCAKPYLPTVFTKVQNYLNWIKSKIGNECLCIS